MSRTADVSMGAKKGLFNFGQPASPTKPVVGGKTNKPLSPGSNYPTTKNIQTERKDQAAVKAKNIKATGAKVKKLISKKEFELSDYVRKKIGEVGSGKDYYQSGR